MDIPALLGAEPDVLEKVQAALAAGAVVDGHAPALSGRELIAYAAAGIRSDHESTTVEEARAKAAPGDARAGPRGFERPEPRRAAPPAGRAASSTSRGASPPTTSSPTTCAAMATSTGCSGGWWPAAWRRPSRSGTPRTCRPGITGWSTAARVRPATGPTSSSSTTCEDFRVRTVIKDGRIAARDGRCLDRRRRCPGSTTRTRSTCPRWTRRAFRLPLAGETCPGDRDHPRPDRHPPRRTRSVRRVDGPLGVRPGARRRADRQHRAAPGLGPDRPGAGQRLRPDA